MDTHEQQVTARLELMREAGLIAGAVSLKYFCDSRLEQQIKCDGSVVTIADHEAEQVIRSAIEAAFPDDAILGEEFGEQSGTSGWRWLLDPIDGTRSFIHGVPLYGTLIALEHQPRGVVEAGLIHMPALEESVWAARDRGCWHETNPTGGGGRDTREARVTGVSSLNEAMVLTTALDYFATVGRDAWLAIAARAGATRGWSDCYAHLLVATGRADAVIEPELSPWDIAPMLPILAEAGGCCTDWRGQENPYAANAISASSESLHAELQQLLTASGEG